MKRSRTEAAEREEHRSRERHYLDAQWRIEARERRQQIEQHGARHQVAPHRVEHRTPAPGSDLPHAVKVIPGPHGDGNADASSGLLARSRATAASNVAAISCAQASVRVMPHTWTSPVTR